jgi:hypothetical protein
MTTYFHLTESMFSEREQLLLEADTLEASAFRFESGVAAIRLRNELGELVLLPFQGQQIWSASFRGRNITMRSMFDQPRATRNYLETYGGFLLHCGFTSMGVPAAGDTHPLHGELPNAPYKRQLHRAGRRLPAHGSLQLQLPGRAAGQALRWVVALHHRPGYHQPQTDADGIHVHGARQLPSG